MITPRVRRVAGWLGQLALALVIVFGVQAWMTRDAPRGAAPGLSGRLINAARRRVAVADYRGKPLLVHFWASWCPVCKFSHGAVESVARDYPVLTVAMQSGADEEVNRHMRQQGWSTAVINDADGQLSRLWKVHGVPMNFILDREGNIRFVERGYTSSLGLRVRLWLAAH